MKKESNLLKKPLTEGVMRGMMGVNKPQNNKNVNPIKPPQPQNCKFNRDKDNEI